MRSGAEWLEQDLMSSSLFPYAAVSVCSLWRDAMSLVPKFWSQVVFLVDPPATPLPAVLSQLSWSQDCQLDVIVTRRVFHDNVDHDHERAQIVSIMNTIRSHIHRIRDLRFHVMFSSSLPSFPTDFHGAAPALQRLQLLCKEDDGGPDRHTSTALSATEREEFECPTLRTLVIDGRNYFEACRRDARWTEKISRVVTLTVSHCKPRPCESLSCYELLLPLAATEMDTLSVNDVLLHPSPEGVEIPDFPYTEILMFEDMHDPWIMNQIFHILGAHCEIRFTRCSFGGITDTFRHFGRAESGGELRLAEIDQDIVPLLRVSDAHYLHITRCPSFNDTTLDAMGSQADGTFACATYMRSLTISNCLNFSIAALR